MPQAIRYTLLSIREMLISAGPFALLAAGLVVLAYLWLQPTPPKTVTLATGPAQSAYDEFGKRYQKALAANGIQVVLLPSEGSSANLQLLREGRADLGFVQGGSADIAEGDESAIESLGSLFVEPVWLFYRESAARAVTATRHTHGAVSTEGLAPERGHAGQWRAQPDGQAARGQPRGHRRAEAVAARADPATVAFLGGQAGRDRVRVGAGIADGADAAADAGREAHGLCPGRGLFAPLCIPHARDVAAGRGGPGAGHAAGQCAAGRVHHIAAHAESTHPALLQLFAQAARDCHGKAGWFNRAGVFPSAEHSEFPLSPEAERAIKGGKPLLQRYLPFWAANLIERMWLVLTIIIAILLPASRIVPPLYEFRIRSRVFRWYAQLRDIEARLDAGAAPGPDLLAELNALDDKAGRINVPLSYADELYALRGNIHLVRKKLLRV
jgi:hypothetical protein